MSDTSFFICQERREKKEKKTFNWNLWWWFLFVQNFWTKNDDKSKHFYVFSEQVQSWPAEFPFV
jgi:hypothetical protein